MQTAGSPEELVTTYRKILPHIQENRNLSVI